MSCGPRIRKKKIASGLRHQEPIFDSGRRPICHALRHTRALDPGNAGANPPAILLKCESDPERHEHQVLRFIAVYRSCARSLSTDRAPAHLPALCRADLSHAEARIRRPAIILAVATSGVRVSEVDPAGTVRAQ